MTLHFLNQGIKYHLGDTGNTGGIDPGTHPIVGFGWAQPFTISHNDQVQVHIRTIEGVDHAVVGDQSKIFVFINDICLGQITANSPWSSPVRCALQGGSTYLLRIVTLDPGSGDPDNFVFEGVSVSTAGDAFVNPSGSARVLKGAYDDYYSSTYDNRAPAAVPPPVFYPPQPVQYAPSPAGRAKAGCWAIGLGILCLLIALGCLGLAISALIYHLSHPYDGITTIVLSIFGPGGILGVFLGILAFKARRKGARVFSIIYCVVMPLITWYMFVYGFRVY